MAEGTRKIKLVIDVSDNEVKSATASMSRLEKATKEVGKSGNDLKNLDDGLKNATTSAAGLAAGFNPIALAVTVATTAVLAFTAALIAATKYAFELAKSFADYGSEIYKAQQLTTLTAETLSTLKIEVEKAGGSFESIIDGLKDYATKIADAAKGSKEAQKELNSLGINGKKYLNDFNGALEAGFKAISKLPIGIAQMSAATKLFGEEASRDLIPIIRKADGDISKLTEELKQFGIVLSQEDVQASREFNKALGEVKMELRGVGLTAGREVLPVFRDLFKEFQGFYKNNKNEIKEWAVFLSDILGGIIESLKSLRENWDLVSTIIRTGLHSMTFGLSELVMKPFNDIVNFFESRGKAKREEREEKNREISWQSVDSSKWKNANANANKYFSPDAEKAKQNNEFHLHKEAQVVFNRFNKMMETEPQFLLKLEEISERFNTQPEWILNVLAFESRLKTNAKNPISSATGLIQVMDNGRKGDGIYEYGGREFTRKQITEMSATEQLTKIIAPYFEPFKNRLTSQSAVYAAVAAGKIGTDDSVFFRKGSKEYQDNRGWDKDKDGKITQKELGQLASQFGFGTAYKLPGRKEVEEMNKIKLSTSGEIAKDLISTRELDAQSKFILGLEEQYKIRERSQILNDRQMDYESEVYAKIQDYNLALKEQLQDLIVEQGVLELRDKYAEAQVEYQRLANAQTAEMADIERDLLVLKAQGLDDQFTEQRRLLAAKREEYDLQKEITNLQDEIANFDVNQGLKSQVEYWQTVLELRNVQKELSQKGTFNPLRSELELTSYLNQNVKSVTQSYVDFRTTIADGAFQQIDSPFERLRNKLEGLPPLIKGIASAFVNLANDMVRAFSQKLISQILGVGSGQSSGGGFSVGNFLQGFMGGRNAGGYSAPGFAGGSYNFPNNFSFAGAGGGSSSFNFSNLGRSPLSTEGTLESTIGLRGGGTYSTGSMLTNASTSQLSTYSQFKQFFSGSNLSSLAMASLPAAAIGLFLSSLKETSLAKGAAKGGIVGLIASIFNRNKLRREEEKVRDKLMVDTLAELNKIKAEMEAARPGTNIQNLLDQTGQISSEYFTQANALKDKKTRNIAIKDGNERVGVVPPNAGFPNALTNQIYALSEAAKAKQQIREFAAERDRRMLPEFAMGGYIPAKNGGHLAVVGEGGFDEFILSTDPRYANRTAKLLGNFIERMNYKIPKFEMGGISSNINLSPSNSASTSGGKFQPNITIVLNNTGMVETDIHEILIDGLKKPNIQVELKKNFDKAKSRRV